MKLKGATIPGHEVFEYFLILSLPLRVQERILELRADFHERFATVHTIKGRPSLALAHFLQYTSMQEKLVERLCSTAAYFPPMHIHLRNFGSFPEHSIYIKVSEVSGIHQLVKNININAKQLLQVNKQTKPMIMLEPHIGIVRKLKPDVYQESWPEYEKKSFMADFEATEMILLRRPMGLKGWETVNTIEFKNVPGPAVQGTLF